MQSLFHPRLGFGFVHAVTSTPQAPQVLAPMPKIQKLFRLRPTVGLEIPNPGDSIAQHQLLLGSRQTPSQGLPMQPLPQVRRVALAAHYYFVSDHSSAPFGSARLFMQIKHPILYFVPFYAVFFRLVLSPSRPAKTRKPPVDHQ